MSKDEEQQIAARASLKYVRDGDVVGLGSGSTAARAIRLLGELVRGGLKIRGIPTSTRSGDLAASLGIPLITLDDVDSIDVTIDGADEFDAGLRLIKGGGGALLREKIVASATRQEIIVADSSKQVSTLGKFPLPVEVIRLALRPVGRSLSALGAAVQLRKISTGEPFVTDEGNYILDCHFGRIPDPPGLACAVREIPGVVEHGLFLHEARVVLMGKAGRVVVFRKP